MLRLTLRHRLRLEWGLGYMYGGGIGYAIYAQASLGVGLRLGLESDRIIGDEIRLSFRVEFHVR